MTGSTSDQLLLLEYERARQVKTDLENALRKEGTAPVAREKRSPSRASLSEGWERAGEMKRSGIPSGNKPHNKESLGIMAATTIMKGSLGEQLTRDKKAQARLKRAEDARKCLLDTAEACLKVLTLTLTSTLNLTPTLHLIPTPYPRSLIPNPKTQTIFLVLICVVWSCRSLCRIVKVMTYGPLERGSSTIAASLR